MQVTSLDPRVNITAQVRDFLAAVNRGDTPALLAFFDAERGVIIDAGRTFVGHAAIRPWNDQEFIGAGGHVTARNVRSSANVVTVVADWKSAACTGPSKFVLCWKVNASPSFGSAGRGRPPGSEDPMSRIIRVNAAPISMAVDLKCKLTGAYVIEADADADQVFNQ